MSESMTCQEFHAELDAHLAGSLAQPDAARCARHAETCSECAMALEVRRRLSAEPLADLEARAPSHLVQSLWPRISEHLAGLNSAPAPPPDRRRSRWTWGRSWLTPALAATVVLFVFAGGWMFGEIRQLRRQHGEMTARLRQQDLLLADYHQQATEGLATRAMDRIDRAGWGGLLTGGRELTAAELLARLQTLPPETVLLEPDQLQRLLQRLPRWETAWGNKASAAVQAGDALRASEVIRIIDTLDLPPDLTISRRRLLNLTSLGIRADADRIRAANTE
jgi:hypothetical protein